MANKISPAVVQAGERLNLIYVKVKDLQEWDRNPKKHDIPAIKRSFKKHGFKDLPKWEQILGGLVEGNGRFVALREMEEAGESEPRGILLDKESGEWCVPVLVGVEAESRAAAEAYAVDHNNLTLGGAGFSDLEIAELWDTEEYAKLIKDVVENGEDFASISDEAFRDIEKMFGEEREEVSGDVNHGALCEKFVVPPFSVLDTRQGYWMERKREWLSLGIKSELGRGNVGSINEEAQIELNKLMGVYVATYGEGGVISRGGGFMTGTSVFDPVLCEIMYLWFSPPGGSVLDPFAGGSVRGIVAGKKGRSYLGVDLSKEQMEANRKQVKELFLARPLDNIITDPKEITPVQKIGKLWVKRDDLYFLSRARGGKVRTCLALAHGEKGGLVTAGARKSPQVQIVAEVARELGLKARLHVPSGELTSELLIARQLGGEIVQHSPGRNSVIVARAREDAKERGWKEIPFGMECQEAIEQTRKQVANIPKGVKRLVITVGSGMSLAGVLWGLKDISRDIPVIGIKVGANPTKRLDKYAPEDWRDMVRLEDPGIAYKKTAVETTIGDVEVDPIYEGKCLPYLKDGDLFWIVGIRMKESQTNPKWIVGDSLDLSELIGDEKFDFVFSCPPYGDLERYSEDPKDLSNLTPTKFNENYNKIINLACQRLKPDRFACFVVGDYRRKDGTCMNFVSKTIEAFSDAGLSLYNEAVLITSLGTLPIRVANTFPKGRKLGKAHQNVLIFVKGDWRKAHEACGSLTGLFIGDPQEKAQNNG